MARFTSIALTGVTFLTNVISRRKPQSPYLLDVLVDGVPKQATLLPPEKPSATPLSMGRMQQLTEDLFGAQRSRQVRSVSSSVDHHELSVAVHRYNRD